MTLKLYSTLIAFFILFLISSSSTLAVAQQNQEQPLMTPVPPRERLVTQMSLGAFEAILGDVSLCADDGSCVEQVGQMKAVACAANICNGADGKDPATCFGGLFDKYSPKDKAQAAGVICSWIKSPNKDTRQALMTIVPGSPEDGLVKKEAFLLALKGSTGACEETIKNYVGAYGPKWKNEWYKALAGCHILSRASTRKDEEKDFYTWFGVIQGTGSCADIVNGELRNACSAPNAGSPALDNGK